MFCYRLCYDKQIPVYYLQRACMSANVNKVVHIKQAPDTKPLSKAQKLFNNLIKKIEAEKKRLQDWQYAISAYQQKYHADCSPLWDSYNTQRIKLAEVLDQSYDNKLFKKTDKQKISHIISIITSDLIAEHGFTELKPLYDKHNAESYDEINQGADEFASDLLKSMFQDIYGVDLGEDFTASSPEELEAKLKERIAEKESLATESAEPVKKSKKQLAKEAKEQKEEQTISQSIREVYRKLTSALHPDREQDPIERERKTLIMQKVNIAYGKKDLLGLLSLQLEAEQIDQSHLDNINEDRLKTFNKILKEQLIELQMEVDRIAMPFRMQRPNHAIYHPRALEMNIQTEIASLKRDISEIKHEISIFSNPNSLKTWLKSYRIPKEPDFPDFMFQDWE